MHGILDEASSTDVVSASAICENRFRSNDDRMGCRPLWLTPREAEALLLLCTVSPVSGGHGEPELFRKLGDYFRLHAL
ncbi:MAG TPA: hypothetical protein VKT77_01070 [Chthonomonadaceae bacterium]|nr:hypothetical protein [Chthonomonadaceae bacterium]